MDISITFQNEKFKRPTHHYQPSAISHQPSAISHQPSAISHQPSLPQALARVYPQMKSTSLHDTTAESICFYGRNRHLSLSDCASEKLPKTTSRAFKNENRLVRCKLGALHLILFLFSSASR